MSRTVAAGYCDMCACVVLACIGEPAEERCVPAVTAVTVVTVVTVVTAITHGSSHLCDLVLELVVVTDALLKEVVELHIELLELHRVLLRHVR